VHESGYGPTGPPAMSAVRSLLRESRPDADIAKPTLLTQTGHALDQAQKQMDTPRNLSGGETQY